ARRAASGTARAPAPSGDPQDDLAEYVAAFHAAQRDVDVVEDDLGVDHRPDDAGRHLEHGVLHVLDAAAERAEDLELLLEELHQVHRGRDAGGGAAGDEAAAALQRQHGAGPGVGPGMLEHHVDALLGGELAHHALEAVLAVVDDVVGAERPGLVDLVVGANGGDDRAAHALCKLDRGRADAGAAGMDEDGLAGLELRIVEQHVLDRAEGDGRDRRADLVDAGRGG